ncbi:Predicted dehydrogenase [Catalinimonas alkaloidigena]|uniref:Predicted dehydrogenase n=1 Tax=Catalinimonas alkaloidigena TaxID=1075417 RepID=A0A1G9RQ01_9BACT|nr:Gfo/Idh/MocA family oxidoreductase [Catalinimonas alkaloidigena]SDM25263.1 Predicted dehydrogenase [Catalinimonas alkaloidigena]
MSKPTSSRRSFLKKLGGTTALVASAPLAFAEGFPQLLKRPAHHAGVAANDRIRLGCIGMGLMGFGDVATALQVPGIEFVAACDLYDGHLQHAKELYGKDIFTTRDFRELLNRKDIDAVIIATTDHWHDHISVAAMEAGKHVYCEKPMVHHIDEGQKVIDTQKKTGKVFQVGSQRVSSIIFEKAKELYESGIIGELNMVEAAYDRHSALGAWQYSIPTDASPQTVDWDRYLGDAPKVPYDPKRFFRWRNYRDYGTGMAGDLFVHLISGLHMVTGSLGPTRIYSSGGLNYWKDGRDVPDLLVGIHDYPKTDVHPAFQLTLRCNFADGSGGGELTRLVGSEGEIQIGWGNLTVRRDKLPKAPGYGGWDIYNVFTDAQKKAFVEDYHKKYPSQRAEVMPPDEERYEAPKGYDERLDHFVNFFEGVRNGKKIVEDATFGLRAAGPALASNMSYFEQRVIHWDPERMQVLKGDKGDMRPGK